METDFSMTLQVGDVNNADELGGWIRQAMTVIERFPSEQLAGPQPGRVTLLFKSPTDQCYVNFSIAAYRQLSPDLDNAGLLQSLSTP